ncbi:MAG TPA: bifunctional shikimate kinase/3-dehydroquinate synthase [Baekduia sp.]|uniref:bifunctional shikimate kinase/3-dehydroquinate synthase n=1 Tax=Baekduia sp. TaxID=2600305 RepID=UPI002D788D91|nr:bifunctional shikimate kinase/3-dehydroquinate synthase [Baekduia sp.]HET6506308.1 bifunctional shikimate kinase/3-dehydroquinate synthase [Baekduia sp.]
MARLTVVIGFMGAGKTTLARELAAARGVGHVDTDDVLVERFGRPIADVFATDGEAAFRAAEEEAVLEVLGGARGEDVVVSLGGGAVLSERVRAALADHAVVLLDVPLDLAWERAAGADRPLAADRDGFAARHAERAEVYAALAHAHLPPVALDRLAALDAALRVLESAPAGTRMTWASAASGEYPVFVGPGVLALAPLVGTGRAFCVTDEAVAEHHLPSLPDLAGLIEMPPGEEHKTLATAERIWHALVAQGTTRADHLVALGGGVVGDVAGFCAATYQRGIPVVQCPTTIVAMVDSAYGGKTGVDLPEAKNYVGAYHQPLAVLVDTTTLATLPGEEFAAGYAEVVKTALIAGGPLWERVASGALPDDDIIFACARTKLEVVAADERDGGRRQVLNLGHTIGHALEVELGYGTLRHGEAVGLGLLAALRLSRLSDLRGQVSDLLAAAGLPTTLDAALPGADPERILAATRRDKKRTDTARTPFVLVRAPGDVVHGQDVSDDDVALAVRELIA